jgi:hypothetical protein
VIDTDRSITPELAERWLRPDGRWIAIRDGRVDLATPRGAPIAARAEAITLRELAALVERDRIFPIAGD